MEHWKVTHSYNLIQFARDLISIEQPGISFRTYIFHRLMRASVTEWELVCVWGLVARSSAVSYIKYQTPCNVRRRALAEICLRLVRVSTWSSGLSLLLVCLPEEANALNAQGSCLGVFSGVASKTVVFWDPKKTPRQAALLSCAFGYLRSPLRTGYFATQTGSSRVDEAK